MIKSQQKINSLLIFILMTLFINRIQNISGKEFASSFLEVLNDMRVNPFEYISYLDEHFKILKKNVFTQDSENSLIELDNKEILLKIDSEIKNLQTFLQNLNKLSPLKKNKHLSRAAHKIAKSNAKKNSLKYKTSEWEKEVKSLPNSKIILEREKNLSALELVNKEKNNIVSDIYQLTGKFHLSFRNMLNCLLMFLSTAQSENDLISKRNLLFYLNNKNKTNDKENKIEEEEKKIKNNGKMY